MVVLCTLLDVHLRVHLHRLPRSHDPSRVRVSKQSGAVAASAAAAGEYRYAMSKQSGAAAAAARDQRVRWQGDECQRWEGLLYLIYSKGRKELVK
jgi:hypothetical protein